MTVEDVRMLTDHWARHPPTNELLELQIGWKPDSVITPGPLTAEEEARVERLLADADGKGA